MEDLFKLEKCDLVQTMSSREISELTGKNHQHVLRDCDVLNENYEKLSLSKIGQSVYVAENGQSYREYLLTKMQCFDLLTGYRVDLRIKVNRRWEELEKSKISLDSITRKDLAKMLLESEEEKEKLQLTIAAQTKELKESATKVEYYDKVLESKGYLTVNMIAAELGISHVKLNKLLCDWGVQYKQTDTYFLTSRYRDKGYTVHRPWPYTDSNGQIKTRQHMYWTEAGKKFVIELYYKKTAIIPLLSIHQTSGLRSATIN